uniref:Uncharacterized protein n=1 Tax=Fusarium oxysporum (strain Fo5176) TaxID=660025 RepID=A0A0D2XJ09_FUSOF
MVKFGPLLRIWVTEDRQVCAFRPTDSDQQIILLSAGGNDAELVNILNQCVYQWFALKDQHSTVGKVAEMKGQLQYSKNIINSDEFSQKIDSVIEATKKKLSTEIRQILEHRLLVCLRQSVMVNLVIRQ